MPRARPSQNVADIAEALKLFCDTWRPVQPAFVEYFEEHYIPVHVRWVRACYLQGHEKDAFRIPKTTSHNESYHSFLKSKDLSGRCVCGVCERRRHSYVRRSLNPSVV